MKLFLTAFRKINFLILLVVLFLPIISSAQVNPLLRRPTPKPSPSPSASPKPSPWPSPKPSPSPSASPKPSPSPSPKSSSSPIVITCPDPVEFYVSELSASLSGWKIEGRGSGTTTTLYSKPGMGDPFWKSVTCRYKIGSGNISVLKPVGNNPNGYDCKVSSNQVSCLPK